MCPSMSSETTKQKSDITSPVSQMNGRQVLQPTCNRVPTLQKMRSLKKISPLLPPKAPLAPSMPSPTSTTTTTTILSAKQRTSTPPTSPPSSTLKSRNLVSFDLKKDKKSLTKSKSFSARVTPILNISEYNNIALSLTTSLILEPTSKQAEERKSRIAHYGRVPKPYSRIHTIADAPHATQSEKRCTFITTNSDPIFVAYHDEEWGVPVHDDRLLFELLVLTGAQVGSDWTTVLKKRQAFKDAFAGFNAEVVAKFSEKQMMSVCATCGMDLSKVRGVVDNANRILEVTREFGSLEKYLWGFVNNKPMITSYKTNNKIPVKTSKSESISKDMMRRGFRSVGPTVIHSFTQAAGLTNDHLISCTCHAKCAAMA